MTPTQRSETSLPGQRTGDAPVEAAEAQAAQATQATQATETGAAVQPQEQVAEQVAEQTAAPPTGQPTQQATAPPPVSTGAATPPHLPEHHAGGVRVPVVHTRLPQPRLPRLPAPHLPVPRAGSRTGRVLWLGGLGTLAVVGVVDWPVAAAIAAGTWVAEQRARERLLQTRAAEHPTGPEQHPGT